MRVSYIHMHTRGEGGCQREESPVTSGLLEYVHGLGVLCLSKMSDQVTCFKQISTLCRAILEPSVLSRSGTLIRNGGHTIGLHDPGERPGRLQFSLMPLFVLSTRPAEAPNALR
jgi:hypothetical protein